MTTLIERYKKRILLGNMYNKCLKVETSAENCIVVNFFDIITCPNIAQ